MRHTARWVALSVGIVVAAFSVVLATQVGGDPREDATKSQLVGRKAPAFSVHTLDGQPVTTASLAGKTVIINFWNTWCIPCIEEIPALKEFYRQHGDDPDFVMVGIVRDDTKDAVRDFVAAKGVGWTVAMDSGSDAALGFATRGQPETFAISPGGTIAAAQIGPSTVDDLETMLDAARRVR